MRRRLLAVLGSCAIASGFATAVAPVPSPPEDIGVTVMRLGSETFAERDAAGRTLERLGTAALPSLRVACRSDDPEIRRRAEAILERIEHAADNARLLAVKPIRLDFKAVPLGTAVNELRAKTGIHVMLDSNRVANPLRPITLQTADLAPWQAVDEFCKAAGLREVFVTELAPLKHESMRTRRGYYTPPMPTIPNATTVPVLLADGRYEALPGDRTSAVRVLALPPNFASNRLVLGSGEVTLNLDVTPLPGLNWQEVTDVRVKQAFDARGRSIPASHRIELPMDTPDSSFDGNVVIMNGRVAMWNSDGSTTPVAVPLPNPRLVPVTLRTSDSGVKLLKLLEGSVQIELILANQSLVSVPDIAKASGTSFDGPNQTRLTISDFRTDAKTGQTSLRLRLESPSPWMMQQMKARRFGANPAAGNVFGGLVFIDTPVAPSQGPQFQVIGADGKMLATTSTNYSSGATDDGSRMFTELGLTFRGGSPTKLVMVGPKTVTVDVPFRFENVPLP